MKHFGEKKPLMKQFGAQTAPFLQGLWCFFLFLRLHAIVAICFGALVLEVPWRVLFLEMH
jgi:hypothetical protein